jgi:hypothetical protein
VPLSLSITATTYTIESTQQQHSSHTYDFLLISVKQTLTPKYEKLAAIFAGDKNILIGKVDATEEEALAAR